MNIVTIKNCEPLNDVEFQCLLLINDDEYDTVIRVGNFDGLFIYQFDKEFSENIVKYGKGIHDCIIPELTKALKMRA